MTTISKLMTTPKGVQQILAKAVKDNYKLLSSRSYCNLILYLYNKKGYKKEVTNFCEKYIDTKTNEIDIFLSKEDEFKKLLQNYEGVAPTLDLCFYDFFFYYYIEESNLVSKSKIKDYIEKRDELVTYDVSMDEGNLYEVKIMIAYRLFKKTKNILPLEKLILERIKLEKFVRNNLETCKTKFKNQDFMVIETVDIYFNEKLLPDLGIIINKNEEIEYSSNSIFYQK